MLTKEELELRRLIYGQSGIIITNGTPKEILMQIELIKTSVSIDGFIFRPNFANSEELTDYTEKDWMAILAQYSLTYGWSDKFTSILGLNAIDVLDQYFAEKETNHKFKKKDTASSDIYIKVEPIEYYLKVLKDIAESKTVLRSQQIQILKLMPIEFIEKSFEKDKFVIKETEILFISKLIEAGSTTFKFKDADQIVKFVVNAFNASTPIEGQLNKTILKDVKLKIPTKFKKKILSDINDFNESQGIQRMKKYKSFWKKLYKQLSFAPLEKMSKRYINAFITRKALYENTIKTNETYIEEAKKIGNYDLALSYELKNPSQMLRNLLQYMRYKKGDTIAKKRTMKSNYGVHEYFDNKNKTENKIVVQDAFSVLKSKKFYNQLLKSNVKLLWQVLTMIKDEKNLEAKKTKKMNKINIKYENPLPGLNTKAVKIVKKQIKNAIKQIKREQNSTLGKIYIDNASKDFAIQFSGREDTSISMSGEYLPTGSIKNLTDILKDENKLLRIGIAWRGRYSCDIDLSMNVDKYGSVFYGNPTLINTDREVVISSSGDVTSNGKDIFSTEFIDVDIQKLKEMGIKWMFNHAIIFSGSTFKNYETYWFMKIINKQDRVINKRKINIKLDEMDYAVKIEEESRGMIGLSFTFGKKDKVEVINIPLRNLSTSSNAISAKNKFDEAIKNRPKVLNLKKAIKTTINKQQFVKDIKLADIVIAVEKSDNMKDECKYLHPGKDAVEIQKIIF